jgi:hypothetical protein
MEKSGGWWKKGNQETNKQNAMLQRYSVALEKKLHHCVIRAYRLEAGESSKPRGIINSHAM